MANTYTDTVTIPYNTSSTTVDTWIETTPWPDRVWLYSYMNSNNPTLRPLTQQEQPPMRGLYKVYIINLKTDQVAEVGPLVAADEDAAKLKAILSRQDDLMIREYNLVKKETFVDDEVLESFDFVVTKLGSVKPRIKKDDD